MKKLISIITLTSILAGILMAGPVSASADSGIKLEKALEIAKAAFDIDTKDHDFNSSYAETQYGKKLWYLNWNSKSSTGSSINITVDAATGEIITMSRWENTYVPAKRIPTYTWEEALKVARELAEKLHPDKMKSTELMDEYQSNLYRPVYSSDLYGFYFKRKVDGIDFQDNGIQIQVEKDTLKVKYFNVDWDTVIPIPDSRKAISKAEAKKIYAEKLGLELAYQMVYPDPSGDPELMLVYSPKYSNNPIDAITGEIITQPYYTPVYGAMEESSVALGAGGYVPTPQEQKVIDESSKYISKEKAMEALKKYVPVDSKYKLTGSNLFGGYNNENASWSFSWEYNENNRYNYIYGTVDAVTGEVKSFSINDSENEYKADAVPKYTKEQCREIAENFLKKIQPDKFASSEFREQYYEIYRDSKNVSSYNMNYIRKEKGISVPGNYLNVTVSTYTGKVTSFNMYWNQMEFPDASGIISLEGAYERLYEKHDLTLKYIRIYNYDKGNERTVIRLVYMPENFYGMIDARSGQFVDYNGKPIKETVKTVFTDIEGHRFEKDIKLLVELGIIYSEDSKFNPDSKIMQKDFVKLLMKSIQPEYYPVSYRTGSNNDYDVYYENAIKQNILAEKDKKPDAPVTRIEASKMLVKALGAGFVADLSSIFTLDFKDGADITAENKGYAAIASALGLADTTQGSFGPAEEITKAETAGMLVNYLKVDKTPKDSRDSGASEAIMTGN